MRKECFNTYTGTICFWNDSEVKLELDGEEVSPFEDRVKRLISELVNKHKNELQNLLEKLDGDNIESTKFWEELFEINPILGWVASYFFDYPDYGYDDVIKTLLEYNDSV